MEQARAGFFPRKNLTDETVQLLKFEQGAAIYASRYNQPRTEGVNLIYRW